MSLIIMTKSPGRRQYRPEYQSSVPRQQESRQPTRACDDAARVFYLGASVLSSSLLASLSGLRSMAVHQARKVTERKQMDVEKFKPVVPRQL